LGTTSHFDGAQLNMYAVNNHSDLALMNPSVLQVYLSSLIDRELYLSVMIWAAPRIGKSSIVQALAN